MSLADLEAIAQALVAPGKGILAADESLGSIGQRFQKVGITSTEQTRRDYRNLLFGAPGIDSGLSGAILFDETMRQKADDGTPFPTFLARRGIVPGIKVDHGTRPLPGFPGETVTEGIDGLPDRLAGYAADGARFAKWRAVIHIGEEIPTRACIHANAHALARYAAICQEAGLVPVVEPEVLMEGAHTIERCERVSAFVLRAVFSELHELHVAPEAMLLKASLVLPGSNAQKKARPERVAESTLRVLRRYVPAAVPGIVFLSGGLGPEAATESLQAVVAASRGPWQLSFSFGRALQDPALSAWRGEPLNIETARKALLHRVRCNAAARNGRYLPGMEATLP